jgi:hypothetical protein
MVDQRPQSLPILAFEFPDVDCRATRESECPLRAGVSALDRYLNSHGGLLTRDL